jgi:hypothetical protein
MATRRSRATARLREEWAGCGVVGWGGVGSVTRRPLLLPPVRLCEALLGTAINSFGDLRGPYHGKTKMLGLRLHHQLTILTLGILSFGIFFQLHIKILTVFEHHLLVDLHLEGMVALNLFCRTLL